MVKQAERKAEKTGAPLITAHLDPEERASQTPSGRATYARAVGDRVALIVEERLEKHPGSFVADPDTVAEAIADIVVDPITDEGHNEMADLLAPFWTARRTAEVLGGLKRSTMSERRKTGSLLGVKTTDGDIFYPIAQFEKRGGRIQVKPAVRKFMMVLRARDPWTVGVLLHTPAADLGDLTPLDWARKGNDEDRLVDYGHRLDAEFSR